MAIPSYAMKDNFVDHSDFIEIANLQFFRSAGEMLAEVRPDWYAGLDEDSKCFVDHFDDFEPYGYFVFDEKKVIVTYENDVTGPAEWIDDYIVELFAWKAAENL